MTIVARGLGRPGIPATGGWGIVVPADPGAIAAVIAGTGSLVGTVIGIGTLAAALAGAGLLDATLEGLLADDEGTATIDATARDYVRFRVQPKGSVTFTVGLTA